MLYKARITPCVAGSPCLMGDCFTCVACYQGHFASQVHALHYLLGCGIMAEGSHVALGYKCPASQSGLTCIDPVLPTGIESSCCYFRHASFLYFHAQYTKSTVTVYKLGLSVCHEHQCVHCCADMCTAIWSELLIGGHGHDGQLFLRASSRGAVSWLRKRCSQRSSFVRCSRGRQGVTVNI